MKRPISLLISVPTLFWIILSSSCASLGLLSPPELVNRTLRFSRDRPALEYQYRVCVKHFLGICSRTEMHQETYDLTDEKIRKQLIDMGFVARSKAAQ